MNKQLQEIDSLYDEISVKQHILSEMIKYFLRENKWQIDSRKRFWSHPVYTGGIYVLTQEAALSRQRFELQKIGEA